MSYTKNAEEILISQKQLSEKVKQLGAEITKDYKNKKLLLVSILKGSVVFLADLMREIKLPLEIDFMCVSSYQKQHRIKRKGENTERFVKGYKRL